MKEVFVPQRFNRKSEALLVIIAEVLEDYAAQGFTLTVRQLYYQLVTRNAIPNKPTAYNINTNLVSDARLAGRIDWDSIVDRARVARRQANWESPAEIVRSAANGFRLDKWADQPWHVEVMVEKQALEGVLIPTCQELDVTFTANKGYSSQTMMYEAGKRLWSCARAGKRILVCYLGDHDPSGIDMTRDVTDRLDLFAKGGAAEGLIDFDITVRRLALNMPQVRQYQPPENPAKLTDSRSSAYVREHGRSSWELDALRPEVLAGLLRRAVLDVRDEGLWAAALRREDAARKKLIAAADRMEGKRKRKKTKKGKK